jgi:lipoteichoic acid synthase
MTEYRSDVDPGLKLIGAGMALGLVLVYPRAQVVNFRYLPSLLARIGAGVLASYYDFLYVAVLTAAFLIPVLILATRRRPSRWWYRAFFVAAAFSVVAAFVNVRIVSVLRRPLSYQWLYYSDFLRSQDARNAIFEGLTRGFLLATVAGVLAFAVLARGLLVALVILRRVLGPKGLLTICVAGLATYFVGGGILLSRRDWDVKILQNPLFSFIRSAVIARRSPQLLTMRTSAGDTDFERPAAGGRTPGATPLSGKGIRNVIVIVLESVPASYVEPYGGPYPATPELTRYSHQSLVFENIYANCPATSFSLVSLLLSTYGGLSFQGLTERRPDASFPSLSSELKQRSYRTAFFSSADLRHQQSDSFLAHRQFDVVRDLRGFPCDTPVLRASTARWPFLDGVDDQCTFSALEEWIQADTATPYFAVLWTMMTHYPYFPGPAPADFGVGEKFNRYLNALRYDDRLLGQMLKALEERGQDRSTLVVVVGDHGQSFGQHGQWTHGQNIYEESVHVPLMFIHPALHGERSGVVGGMIDIGPTILEILGLETPARWQGRSLFSPERTGRAYFFAPFSDLLFGFREGPTKVIYDASDNHFEVYDLEKDPKEAVNRRSDAGETIGMGRQRLAAWAQYQNRMMLGLLAGGSR